MRKETVICSIVALMGPVAVACAIPTIDVGINEIYAEAGQTVQLLVSGGDAVEGLNLIAQIGDGNTSAGPHITGLDVTTGTVFGPNHTPPSIFVYPSGGLPNPLFALAAVTTAGGSVNVDGLLATLTLDASMYAGLATPQNPVFVDLLLRDTSGGSTDFAGVDGSIVNGQIRIVPEPASLLLLIAGLSLVCQSAIRRRR